jgi:hypothetical protein
MDRRVVAGIGGMAVLGALVVLWMPGPSPTSSERPDPAVAASSAEPPPAVESSSRRVTRYPSAPVAEQGPARVAEALPVPPQEDAPATEEPEAAAVEPVLYPLDREGVRDAIRAASKEIKACYDTLLDSYPDMSGRITVGFTMVGRGDHTEVVGADITQGTLDSTYMEGCVVTAMEDIHFEAAPEGDRHHVSWPFVFRTD